MYGDFPAKNTVCSYKYMVLAHPTFNLLARSLCGSVNMWGHIAGRLCAEVGTCGVTLPGDFLRKWGHVGSHRRETLCVSGDMWCHIAWSLCAAVGTCGITSPGVFMRKWEHVGSHRRESLCVSGDMWGHIAGRPRRIVDVLTPLQAIATS